jgi:hypothetical protein
LVHSLACLTEAEPDFKNLFLSKNETMEKVQNVCQFNSKADVYVVFFLPAMQMLG